MIDSTGPRAPEDLGGRLAELCELGDIEAILELHEPEAIVRVRPDGLISGLEEIRQSFTEMLSEPVALENEVLLALQAGGLALTISKWRMSAKDGDDADSREGIGIEVLREQPDGSWRLVIDNAIGLDGLATDSHAPPAP